MRTFKEFGVMVLSSSTSITGHFNIKKDGLSIVSITYKVNLILLTIICDLMDDRL